MTAASNGTATITATAGLASGTATMTVAQNAAALVREPDALKSVYAGVQGWDTIAVTALDALGSPIEGLDVRWDADGQWVFPIGQTVTDHSGRASTAWVAGWPGAGSLSSFGG